MNERDRPLSVEQAESYRAFLRDGLIRICNQLDQHPETYPELARLLNSDWRNRIEEWIASVQAGKPDPPTQLHHLFYALADERHPQFYFGLDVLEERMQVVSAAVKRQGKTKKYKSTPRQLVANHANQVHTALLEISVLYALIKADPDTKLYPQVGEDGNDVEASISPAGRDIYCECAGRGYSPRLDERQGAIDPRAAPIAMVEATLLKKLGQEGQLTHVAEDHPTILFTCIGFDGLDTYYVQAMKEGLASTPCSAAVIFTRYHCGSFTMLLNEASPHPLREREVEAVKASLVQHLGSRFLGLH